MTKALLVPLMLLAGCQFYFGDDDHCIAGHKNDGFAGVRNPQTGRCEVPSSPDDCWREPTVQNWASCASPCEGLDEASCRAADACRAVYVTTPNDDGPRVYAGCWGVAPSGPIQGGGCSGLDGYQCSRHNDCIALHAPGPRDFLSCAEEAVCDAYSIFERRNPETGQCEAGPGSGSCDGPGPADNWALSDDWALCGGPCEGLDEASCRAADACRAIYGTDDASTWFFACWGTAPESGPIQGEDCDGLDAYQCSWHNDCIAVHGGGEGPFLYCAAEEICAQVPSVEIHLRDPASGACVDWGPPEPCTGYDTDQLLPDWAECTTYCTGLGELSCRAADGCRAIYSDPCPPWVDCDSDGPVFTECWATAPTGPVRGGGCVGLGAQECSRHDDCIAEHARRWDEPCPDVGLCWQPDRFLRCRDETAPPPPCETLAAEAACIEAAHCVPLYEGSGCSCDAMGCGCETWTFVACTT